MPSLIAPKSPPTSAECKGKEKAFSLVELSIVLVILGLLVGGVLSGQSLIRAAELRAVSTEYNRYTAALYSFRDKYFAIAGDMPNATRFWGVQAGSAADGRDATCAALDHTTPSTDSRTCNGDGDGGINGIPANVYERYRMWQHLANAGLIEGSYTGVHGNAGVLDTIAGVNTPKSKTDGGSWSFIRTGNGVFSGDPNVYDGSYGNAAEIRNDTVSSLALLKPEEAWNIDSKMDDGLPGQGKIRTYNTGIQPNCGTTAVASTARYNLTHTSKACSFIFITGL